MSAGLWFDYSRSEFPVREDIVGANRRTWEHVAAPGAWWTGRERVAIAQAMRTAGSCGLCKEREHALSPNAVQGVHEGEDGSLPVAAFDAVHRLVNDHKRLSSDWISGLAAVGVSDGHYVELVGVVVTVLTVDVFHRALGLEAEPLPDPVVGDITGYRPSGLVEGEAWVPMIGDGRLGDREKDIFPPVPIMPYILRALSLVPDAVRAWCDQSAAYYIEESDFIDPFATGSHSLARPQIELLASRVSFLNECFY